MSTQTDNINTAPQSSALTPFSDAPKMAPSLSTSTKATGGEKLFNGIAYWGLGWVANATFSVWLTDKIAQGGLYHVFDEAANKAKNYWPFSSRELEGTSIAAGKEHLRDFQTGILNGIEGFDPKHDATKKPLSPPNIVDTEKLQESANKGKAKLNLPTKERLAELREISDTPKHGERQFIREIKQSLKKYSEHHTISHGGMANFITENSPKIITKSDLLKANVPIEDYFKDGTAKGKARSIGALLTLMSGGFALMAPIKIMEDHKEGIVTKFDDWLSPENKRSASEEANIEARHQELAEEPKQTWLSQISGRGIALVPIITTHFTLGSQANMISKYGKEFKGLEHYSSEAAAKTGEFLRNNPFTKKGTIAFDKMNAGKIERLVEKNNKMGNDTSIRPSKKSAAERSEKHFKHVLNKGELKTNNIIDFANIDAGYSLAAASLTYAGTRFTNKLLNDDTSPDCPPSEHNTPEATPNEKPETVLQASHKNIDTSIIADGKLSEIEHSTTRV